MFKLKNLIKLTKLHFKKNKKLYFLKKYKFFYFFLNYFTNLKKYTNSCKKILYVIFNNNKKQTFVNILNSYKKNKHFLSTGVCIKYNKNTKSKSLKRSIKGLLMLLHMLKKNLIKNKKYYFFFLLNSSRKLSIIILKELSFFLKKIKKKYNLVCWQTKLKNKTNVVGVRRIKRRLKKRILKHEAGTFIN